MASVNPKLVALPKETLLRLQNASLLPEAFWTRFHNSPKITELDLIHIADELGLDPVQIAEGKVDYQALEAQSQGNISRVPERYSKGSSRTRTSAHLFDMVESLFGWRKRTEILRRRQVTESTLSDLDREVSIHFLCDVLEEMRQLGLSDQQFYRIGEQSLIRNYSSPVGTEFRATRNIRGLYEKCFLEIIQRFYDQNTFYHLVSLDENRAVIDALPNPEVCDSLGEKQLGSRLVCLNKAGGFASLAGYKRLPFADVRETQCIHRGDLKCRFEINFERAKEFEHIQPRRDLEPTPV